MYLIRHFKLLLIALAIGILGCSAGQRDVAWPVPRPLGNDLKTYRPAGELAPGASGLPKFDELTGTIGLRDALSAALLRNPELAVFSWEVRAGQARVLQASLPPNPELEIEIEEIRTSSGAGTQKRRTTFSSDGSFKIERETEQGPAGGFGNAQYAISIWQAIELGGKRAKRTRVALLERDLAGWDYEAKRIDVLTEVTKAFVGVLAAQERLALAERLVDISKQIFNTVAQRVKAGKQAPLEETKARVELSSSITQTQRARSDLKIARHRLVAMWGSSSADFQKAQGRFDLIKPIPVIGQVVSLIGQNPEIARYAAEMERHRAQVELAKANGIGDLTVGGGIQHFGESNDTAIILGISLSLPLFDRNQGNIKEAGFLQAKAAEERRAAEVRGHAALTEAYQTLASAVVLAKSLKNDVLPGAQEAFEAAREGYSVGKYAYLDVLDAQRTLFEAKGQYIEALSASHKARADVERLIGQRIDTIETIQ